MRRIIVIVTCIALAMITMAAKGSSEAGDPNGSITWQDDELFAKFKKEANTAAFTVYPVYFTSGNPMRNMGDVIALFMEQKGMENVISCPSIFTRTDSSNWDGIIKEFSDFVVADGDSKAYNMYAEVLGGHLTGIAEVRAAIVNKQGQLVWSYKSVKGSDDFKKYYPANPMTCSVMISTILQKNLGLHKRSGFNLRTASMRTYWEKNTGTPDKREQEAIESRATIARKNYKTSTVTVFPSLYWGPDSKGEFLKENDLKCAENIASMLDKKVFASATAIDCKDKFDFAGNSNQMRVCWTLARKFSAYLKDHPVGTDYALIAHYSFNRQGKGHGLHIIGCTGNGDLVEVALFNDHHKVFKNAGIISREKADKFVVEQIKEYLK